MSRVGRRCHAAGVQTHSYGGERRSQWAEPFSPQLESTAMPYLQVLSEFREGVRKIAREKQGEAGGLERRGVTLTSLPASVPSGHALHSGRDGHWEPWGPWARYAESEGAFRGFWVTAHRPRARVASGPWASRCGTWPPHLGGRTEPGPGVQAVSEPRFCAAESDFRGPTTHRALAAVTLPAQNLGTICPCTLTARDWGALGCGPRLGGCSVLPASHRESD